MNEYHTSDVPAAHSNPTSPIEIDLPTDTIFFGKEVEQVHVDNLEQKLGKSALDNFNLLD